MTAIDTRNLKRASLFLMAELQLDGAPAPARVKVRNLSDTGIMLEGDMPARQGQRATVAIKQIGTVGGAVAWVQNNRIGIAFDTAIDSSSARVPLLGDLPEAPRYARPAVAPEKPSGILRKV